MARSKLTIGSFGDEVRSLHTRLRAAGLEVKENERERGFFGPDTRTALLKCQAERGLECTGELDENTAAILGNVAIEPIEAKPAPPVSPTAREGSTGTPLPASAPAAIVTESSAAQPLTMAEPNTRVGEGLPVDRIPPPVGTDKRSANDTRPRADDAQAVVAGQTSQQVVGQIVLEHGSPASNVTVRLYHYGLGGARTLLQEVKTSDRGEYAASYASSDLANVAVFAVSADGREVQLSETKFGAQAEERIDLLAPSSVQPLASEFARLTSAVTAGAGSIDALRNAVERGNQQDFSYLAGTTGWDRAALALASEALAVEAHTKIPADGLYAMARAGLPMDLRTLARVPKQTVAQALRKATEAGLVDAAAIDRTTQAIAEFAVDYRFNNSIHGALSAPKDFVRSARVNEEDRTAFTQVVREERTGGLWDRAREAGVSEDGVQKLQLQGKLAYLTFNNSDLVDYLFTQIAGDPRELIALGYYDAGQWEKTLDQLSSGNPGRRGALVPPVFKGRDVEERVDAYAEELARRVRQMDPHAVTVQRIGTGKIAGISDADNVGRFLKNAASEGYRLGKTPLTAFVKSHEETVWNGIDDGARDSVMNTARTLSALYSITPSDEAISIVLRAGFTSASSIAMYDYDTFEKRIKPFLPEARAGETRTLPPDIFWKARQQSATVFNVFDGLKRLSTVPYAPGSTPQDIVKRGDQIVKVKEKLSGLFPTLETLFGSVDYCECEHCQSVLSPAAYLVDLLHFLDPNEEAWATIRGSYKERTGVDYTKRKPFDVLNDRRPDIKNIALTCENTNTALPYIDVVNEVLEQLMMSDQTPPAIDAFDVGEASSEDLLAEPHNILWSAYVGHAGKKGLRDLVYPVTLPFDLPLEMVRAFLKQLELPLWRLRECLARPTALSASAGRADGWSDVWLERLGLSPGDIAVMTSANNWYELFGFGSASDALKTETIGSATSPAETSLRNGRTLARRLGVTYKELVELVRTRFINPHIENLIVLNRLGVDPNIIDRYFGEGEPLSSAIRTELEASLHAQGVDVTDLRPLRAEAIRKATVVLRSPSVGCDFSRTTLAFDQNPPDPDQAMTLILLKMNVFMRLQRKLGWDIHELDRALMALTPGMASLTMEGWADAMRTALIYVAHVEELRERLQDRLSREEILVLWSDIPTSGVSCLYERLFVSAAVLGGDPVFKKKLGRAVDGSASIADHIDGIRQALQLAHDDIEPILLAAGASDRMLSIQNLSILMRHAVFAKGLELPVAELLALLSLSTRKPLSLLDAAPVSDIAKDIPWSETLPFVRDAELIREAETDVALIERVCRHRGVVEEPGADSDPVLVAVLALAPAEPGVPEKQQLVLVQTLAAQLSAPETLVDTLIGRVLKDATGKALKEVGFSDASRAAESLRRLRKALDLVQSLGITDGELAYLLNDPAALNPHDLPTSEVTSQATAQSLMKGLGAWLELVAARKQFGKSERLLSVMTAAKQPIDADNPQSTREKALHAALSALIGLKEPAWIAAALDAIGAKSTGSTFEVSALTSPARVRRAVESLKSLIRLGLNPVEVVQFVMQPITETVAQKVRSSLKGRYARAAWRQMVKPVFNSLRAKQRDALVAHLTHLMKGDRPKYGETTERLFEYLLLDPGMEPVVVASRIQLAIASVQLFVQRCLMNLEAGEADEADGVDPQIIDSRRWEWMRRYRVWEVNRKMFIWPENLLDPEFRDDKTHIFRDLEGKLLQDDVNDDLVRNALHDYLKGLEEIARLEMLTMYFEPGVSADSSIVHVVARTPSGPLKYFYRRLSHGMWTPWEPIDVGIEGAHLVLTAWRGRVHLFWVSFLEEATKNKSTPPSFKPSTDVVTLENLRADTKVKVQLHWVEQIQGKWVNRSATPNYVETLFEGKATTDADKDLFFVRAVRIEHEAGVADDDLEIHITSAGKGHKFVFFSKLAPPRSEQSGVESSPPPFVESDSGQYLPRRGTKWRGSGALRAKFVSAVTQNSETEPRPSGEDTHRVLGGDTGFALLFPSNESLPVPARTPPSGVGRPSGFIFRPQKAQHVAYRSGDGSIYDLFWTANGWFYQSASADADRSDTVNQPEPAASDPHGYPVDDRGMICLAYAGATKIHELVWSQLDQTLDDPANLATGWHIETLYQGASQADQPQGRPLGGMFLPARGVVFRTNDGRLLASTEPSSGSAWDLKELNTGLPRADSDPTGLLMTKTQLGDVTVTSRHIFYVGSDGDVHELRSDATGQNWTHTNITSAIAGVVKPAPRAMPAAYAFLTQNTLHVVYRGTDDRIHELWGLPGSWNYNAIGAPFTKAIGDPAGYVTESYGSQHVVYRGQDDKVVELWWYGIWREHVLSNTVPTAPKPKSDVAGYSFEAYRTQHVVYFAQDGSPRELWWNPSGWHGADYELQNPFPDPLGPLATPFFYESAGKDHTFFVEPFVVETAVHEWTEWIVTTEEYVVPQLLDMPLITLNPNIIQLAPNEHSLLKQPGRFREKLYGEGVIIRTSKGAFVSQPKPQPGIDFFRNADLGTEFDDKDIRGGLFQNRRSAVVVDITRGGGPAMRRWGLER